MTIDPKYLVPLETPCVYFESDFLPDDVAHECYADLLKSIKWEKTSKINRWVSLHHSDDLKDYQYRDAPGDAVLGFTETIQKIQQKAQQWYLEQTQQQIEFNVCLLNYYENGQQGIGWHSDREEIGRTTPIASISLGTPRQFMLRNKTRGPHDRATLDMSNGSMVIMDNICQHEYMHSVPKQLSVEKGRINLTFRCKDFTTEGEKEHERHDDWLSNITEGATPSANVWSLPDEKDGGSGISIGNGNGPHIFGDNVDFLELDPDFPTIYFMVKTNLGAERYCGAEIQEVFGANEMLRDQWRVIVRPLGLDGFVACCCAAIAKADVPRDIVEASTRVLLGLKSAHHVMDHHMEFDMKECCTPECPTPGTVTAERLYEYFKQQVSDETVVISSMNQLADDRGGGTFRATCDRIGGPHAFQGPDVEREMGGSLAEYYFDRNVRAKMEDYDVCIRIEILSYRIVVGTQLNVSDLSKDRHFLKFRNAVTVKTNLAYALVRLGNIQKGQTIMDPFCGSGTIILEALEVYKKQIFGIGLDVSKRSAAGARDNALAEGYGPDVCKFMCSDARGLRRHVTDDESVDAIVSNLPWGVQTGQQHSTGELATLYEIFLRTAWYTLKPGGRIVMLVLRGLQMTRIVRKLSGRYRLLSVNVVRTTNNLPSIVVVEKLERDDVRDSIKGQLAYMNQYVSVSPEIYQAIHMEAIDEDDR